MIQVRYAVEPELETEQFVNLLHRSTLALRRPVNETERIRTMLQHADVVITARVDGQLVGVSRAITDFAYCTHLSDLAVHQRHQRHRRQGIGRELLRRTHQARRATTTEG